MEDNNLGFHVLRAEGESQDFQRITEQMIQGGGDRASRYEVEDRSVTPGRTYAYQIEAIDFLGGRELIELASVTVARVLPRRLALHPARPNPFNPSTIISFDMVEESRAKLTIHDVSGRVVRTLVDGHLAREYHSFEWDGRDDSGRAMGSGVYIYQLRVGNRTLSGKMVLTK